MAGSGDRFPRREWLARVAALAAVGLIGDSLITTRPTSAHDEPKSGDDATFRPTVMVRKGVSVGTGTVIASIEDETLVLTAAHVVEDPGPLHIELHRFNLGLEKARDARGFPRKFPATVEALETAADLAILGIRGQLALPYVARIARGVAPPEPGTAVTSIGFDRGQRLIGWSTKTRQVERIDLEKGGGARPFLVTDDPPELGRSGGGLFRPDGALVGVCVGRAELVKGRKIGLFTTLGNVKALLREHGDLAASVARSNLRPGPEAR